MPQKQADREHFVQIPRPPFSTHPRDQAVIPGISRRFPLRASAFVVHYRGQTHDLAAEIRVE